MRYDYTLDSIPRSFYETVSLNQSTTRSSYELVYQHVQNTYSSSATDDGSPSNVSSSASLNVNNDYRKSEIYQRYTTIHQTSHEENGIISYGATERLITNIQYNNYTSNTTVGTTVGTTTFTTTSLTTTGVLTISNTTHATQNDVFASENNQVVSTEIEYIYKYTDGLTGFTAQSSTIVNGDVTASSTTQSKNTELSSFVQTGVSSSYPDTKVYEQNVTTTFKNFISFLETQVISAQRGFATETRNFTIINYSSSVGTTYFRKDSVFDISKYDYSITGTVEYSIGDGITYRKNKLSPFVSNYEDELIGFAIPFQTGVGKFSDLFQTYYEDVSWDDNIEVSELEEYLFNTVYGDNPEAPSITVTTRPATVFTYESISRVLSTSDTTYWKESIITQSVTQVEITSAINQFNSLVSVGFKSSTTTIPSTVVTPTTLLVDPLNKVYTTIAGFDFGKTTTSIPYVSAATRFFTKVNSTYEYSTAVTNSSSFQNGNTASGFSETVSNNISISADRFLTYNLHSFNTKILTKNFISELSGECYVIRPSLPKGFIGFNSQKFYQTFETSAQSFPNILRTTTNNHNGRTKIEFACPNFILYEEYSYTLTSTSSVDNIVTGTSYDTVELGLITVSVNIANYETFETTTSFLKSYQPTVSSIVSTVNDRELKVFYSYTEYDKSLSTKSMENIFEITLQNECSFSSNYDIDFINQTFLGGWCPENKNFTLFYKGLVKLTYFDQGSSTVSMQLSNSQNHYSTQIFNNNMGIAIKSLPLYSVGSDGFNRFLTFS